MPVPKSIVTMGEYLKKFGSFLSLSVDLGYQTRKVILIQINSER
ncbi:hypothetical protein CANDROIZ_500009 [Candidatus Roizmanbacteria bacterium]|nr:hypothetical protein CANDROIZ_500009 [Candidatus Roizmanbacteria bacterium]